MRAAGLIRRRPSGPRWLAALALASLLAAGYLLVSPGDSSRANSTGADGYSRSAIGHRGLLRMLRAEGETVVQLRLRQSLQHCGLLVLAEPRPVADDAVDGERLAEWLAGAAATLVVLPKRRGLADPYRPRWVDRVELLPEAEVAAVLAHVQRWAEVESAPVLLRVDAASDWQLPDGWPPPSFDGALQLLQPDPELLEPLIRCAQGVLLGRLGGLYVLSDPDLLANHGLGRGDNAALLLTLLRALREDGTLVFDETLHGHRLQPSAWHALGRFPLVLVAVHLLLLLALSLWIARGRFGPAAPPSPAFADGKRFLIDNTAALLRRAGHHGPSLRRYGRQRVRSAAEALHAPRGSTPEQCRDWLAARLRDPAQRAELQQLLEREAMGLPVAAAVAAARRIHEITAGASHAGR